MSIPVLLMPFLTMLKKKSDSAQDVVQVKTLLARCAQAGIVHDDLS
jgi:hypothetical protein